MSIAEETVLRNCLMSRGNYRPRKQSPRSLISETMPIINSDTIFFMQKKICRDISVSGVGHVAAFKKSSILCENTLKQM